MVQRTREHLPFLLQAKFDPAQPRDAFGRWTDVGAPFGKAPDGTSIFTTAGIPESEHKSTVQSFVSRYCNAGIRAEMPGQFLGATIQDVMELARKGDAAARTCLKLLSRGRFQK